MSDSWRWDPCVSHRGDDARAFFSEYFGRERRVQLVCGAGFDPRAALLCEHLCHIPNISCFLVREERPNPNLELRARADANCRRMQEMIPRSQVQPITIFAPDGAVVGGRMIVSAVGRLQLEECTDVIVDISAMSAGVAFPLIRYFCEYYCPGRCEFNLHIVAVDAPALDQAIVSEASDRPEFITGFKGNLNLDMNSNAIKLWLPQLVHGKQAVLERLRAAIDPHEICPILPFPSIDPRVADELVEEYAEEFESTWNIDARSLIYADEQNPLDLYRSILRIADARKKVFGAVGGSEIVLSPAGSKALSIGTLMAAIERDFPVMYVESVSYQLSGIRGDSDECGVAGDLLHVWLRGDVYPQVELMT